jgi:hypothetical protein
MTMRLAFVAATVVAILGIVLYLGHREDVAEQRGVDQQVARDIAKANQEIATRRETDAKFDSQDARALCTSMGLEWMSEQGKSFCR